VLAHGVDEIDHGVDAREGQRYAARIVYVERAKHPLWKLRARLLGAARSAHYLEAGLHQRSVGMGAHKPCGPREEHRTFCQGAPG